MILAILALATVGAPAGEQPHRVSRKIPIPLENVYRFELTRRGVLLATQDGDRHRWWYVEPRKSDRPVLIIESAQPGVLACSDEALTTCMLETGVEERTEIQVLRGPPPHRVARRFVLPMHSANLGDMSMSPDGALVAITHNEGLLVFDTAGRRMPTIEPWCYPRAWSGSGKNLRLQVGFTYDPNATAWFSGDTSPPEERAEKVWWVDPRSGKTLTRTSTIPADGSEVFFSPSGRSSLVERGDIIEVTDRKTNQVRTYDAQHGPRSKLGSLLSRPGWIDERYVVLMSEPFVVLDTETMLAAINADLKSEGVSPTHEWALVRTRTSTAHLYFGLFERRF